MFALALAGAAYLEPALGEPMRPYVVIGDAIYAMPDMTFQGPLAKFFADPGEVDTALFEAFQRYLRHENQVNGSFYKKVPGVANPSGLRLPEGGAPSPPRRSPATSRSRRA